MSAFLSGKSMEMDSEISVHLQGSVRGVTRLESPIFPAVHVASNGER